MPRRTIALGSNSVLKRRAVELARDSLGVKLDIVTVSAESGVNAQPIGDEEIATGAQNRAQAAHFSYPDALAIGIESGLIRRGNLWADIAAIAVLFPGVPDHCVTFFWTDVMIVPSDAVREVLSRGPNAVTIGQVLAERDTDCRPDDPHSWLSGGRLSRADLIAGALLHPLQVFLDL